MAKQRLWEFSVRSAKPDLKTLAWLYTTFVLECPVPGVSVRGVTFAELGYKGAPAFSKLRRRMMEAGRMTRDSWRAVDRLVDFDAELKAFGADGRVRAYREFVIYWCSDKGSVGALFYMIRNALAHGSFKLKRHGSREYLLLEAAKNENVRGRAFVSLETLRAWSDCLGRRESKRELASRV